LTVADRFESHPLNLAGRVTDAGVYTSIVARFWDFFMLLLIGEAGLSTSRLEQTRRALALPSGSGRAHFGVGAAIGAGGMREVYRATDTKLGRDRL
jgi:hypothetical protein